MQTSLEVKRAVPKTTREPRGFGRVKVQEIVAGYAFMLPSLLILVIFLVLPIFASFVLVFMKYDLLSPPEWSGFRNIVDCADVDLPSV